MDALDEIHEARKLLLEAGKDWVHKAKYAETAKAADMITKEGTDKLLDLYHQFAFQPVSGILELQRPL